MQFGRTPICEHCWIELAPQSGVVCFRCSEDLHLAAFLPAESSTLLLPDRLCQVCRLAPPPFARAVAYGGYTGNLRSLIHALKYDGMVGIADRLGILLAQAMLKLMPEGAASPDTEMLVIAVPLHPSKQKQRGFNHAEVLARAAIKALRSRRPEWKLRLAAGLLERRKATQSQAGLSPHQRRANLRGVFFAPSPERLAGKHILLIDDIYTTGATARACSQVLRRAGAASVQVATVARPQRETFAAPQFAMQELPMREDVAFWDAKQEPGRASHSMSAAS